MARKMQTLPSGSKTEIAPGPTPPEGWASAVAQDGAGYWRPEVGAVLTGRLLGRHVRQTSEGERAYYQVRLSLPALCTVPVGDGETWDEAMLDPGEIVSVDEKVKLSGLAAYVDQGRDVWVHVVERKKIRGRPQAMYVFDVRVSPPSQRG